MKGGVVRAELGMRLPPVRGCFGAPLRPGKTLPHELAAAKKFQNPAKSVPNLNSREPLIRPYPISRTRLRGRVGANSVRVFRIWRLQVMSFIDVEGGTRAREDLIPGPTDIALCNVDGCFCLDGSREKF